MISIYTWYKMAIAFQTFIGVEASGNRTHPFTYALMDMEKTIRSIGHGSIRDAFAFLAGQENALAAINSPASTNKGLMKREKIRKKISAKSHLGRWANLRLVEFELIQRGIRVPHTPGSLKNSPKWMRLGFQLFEEIGRTGYSQYPHPEASKQYFECHGDAAFWNLLGHTPLREHTLEGCLQRQLVLRLCGLPVPDAMRFFEEITRHRLLSSSLPSELVYSGGELNAVVAAYTAWLAANQAEMVVRVGDEEEGIIVLPDHQVLEQTKPEP